MKINTPLIHAGTANKTTESTYMTTVTYKVNSPNRNTTVLPIGEKSASFLKPLGHLGTPPKRTTSTSVGVWGMAVAL